MKWLCAQTPLQFFWLLQDLIIHFPLILTCLYCNNKSICPLTYGINDFISFIYFKFGINKNVWMSIASPIFTPSGRASTQPYLSVNPPGLGPKAVLAPMFWQVPILVVRYGLAFLDNRWDIYHLKNKFSVYYLFK